MHRDIVTLEHVWAGQGHLVPVKGDFNATIVIVIQRHCVQLCAFSIVVTAKERPTHGLMFRCPPTFGHIAYNVMIIDELYPWSYFLLVMRHILSTTF